MNYDFFAQHPVNSRQDATQLNSSMDPYARILLFSQALLSSDKEKIRQEHYKPELNKLVPPATKNLMASLGVDTPKELDLTCLPFGSFFISFQFQLVRPYISGDDETLYIIDNPIAKEKVFKVPMVHSTGWKGALRSAICLKKDWGTNNNHPDLLRLFGTVNDNDGSGKTGYLYFYPSFFDAVDLEIINPHDRGTKAGKQPIYFEAVRDGTQATFTLLYAPLDCISTNEAKTRQQIFADLQLVAEGLEAMFTLYGFGAKTSSGFGLVTNAVRDGVIVVGGLEYKSSTTEVPPTVPPQPDLPRYLSAPGWLSADFASNTGSLKSEAEYQKLVEGRGQKYAKKDKQLYDKAKSWWEREGQQLVQQQREPEIKPEPVVETPPYSLAREAFETFTQLPTAAKKLAEALRQMGGAA